MDLGNSRNPSTIQNLIIAQGTARPVVIAVSFIDDAL